MRKKTRRMKAKGKPLVFKKGFWFGISSGILACSVAYALLFSPLFEVRNITVEGVETLSADEIKERVVFSNVPFGTRNSIFFVRDKETELRIEQDFPKIGSVEVRRVFPHTLEVRVSERAESFVWCQARCFAVDGEGIAFEEREGPGRLTVYGKEAEVRDRVLSPERARLILETVDSLEAVVGMEEADLFIPSLTIISEETVYATTSEGWEVYLSLMEDLAWQISKFGAVFERELSPERRARLEYVDVRFGDQAYVK